MGSGGASLVAAALLLLMLSSTATVQAATTVFTATFATGLDGFAYADDKFRGTANPLYASGARSTTAGANGSLRLYLGGVDVFDVRNMSGGFSKTFALTQPAVVSVDVLYQLIHPSAFESDESAQVLCSIDGVLLRNPTQPLLDYIVQVNGTVPAKTQTVGFTTVSLATQTTLAAGSHTITVGGFLNKKNDLAERSTIYFDTVTVKTLPPPTKAPVTKAPTRAPTKAPTRAPTKAPTRAPTKAPTRSPTKAPTSAPTKAPTRAPTKAPTRAPTKAPTSAPTKAPTGAPTKAPTRSPTREPTSAPATAGPAHAAPAFPSATHAPVSTASSTLAPAPANETLTPIRINCGATADYIDSLGRVWSADQYYSPSITYSAYFSGDPDITLHGTERYWNKWVNPQPFGYEIPVPVTGPVAVNLIFCETYVQTVGGRVFDVWVEGSLVASGYDIFEDSGYEKVSTLSLLADITDGFLTIKLTGIKENPKITAIEILDASFYSPPTAAPSVSRMPSAFSMAPIPSKAPATLPPVEATLTPTSSTFFRAIRINCGSAAVYTDSSGVVWGADQYFSPSIPYTHFFPGNNDVTLYGSERYWNKWVNPAPSRYEIPIPISGPVAVNLIFCESYITQPGGRVFNIWVEGALVAPAFDIFAKAGFEIPTTVAALADVTDGFLTIEFNGIVENPKITAIEVLDASLFNPPTTAPTTSIMPSASPTGSMSPTSSPMPTAEPVFTDIYINCGGNQFIGTTATWSADKFFTGGGTYADGTNAITPTLDDGMYQSERNGDFSYEIPVPVGVYNVELHLAGMFGF
jgi:outer membrane biosynthesis protein TonB